MTDVWDTMIFGFLGNVIPDYLSLLETRLVLAWMKRTNSPLGLIGWMTLDLVATACTALFATYVLLSFMWVGTDPRTWQWSLEAVRSDFSDPHSFNSARAFFIPGFFTSIWLWLYAGSGFLLKAARRFDIGFNWFNRKFDIEKKPLQSIGLVAGALVAVAYWTAVMMRRLV